MKNGAENEHKTKFVAVSVRISANFGCKRKKDDPSTESGVMEGLLNSMEKCLWAFAQNQQQSYRAGNCYL